MEVVVLRDHTVEPLVSSMSRNLQSMGISCNFLLGGFGIGVQEAETMSGPIASSDAIIVLQDLSNRVRIGSREPSHLSLGPGAVAQAMVEDFREALSSIRRYSDAPILINEVLPANGLGPLYGDSSSRNFLSIVQTLHNERLQEVAENSPGVVLLRWGALATYFGSRNLRSERFWFSSQMPYARQGLKVLENSIMLELQRQRGVLRKGLILDCDNTLWGGILDEVGIEGIQIGEASPGNVYASFQSHLLELRRRGIFLALCSKNNLIDVKEVFEKHPGMVLKWSDIDVAAVNWSAKSEGIVQIASKLNVSLDALIFIDDSEWEVEEVKSTLPDVASFRFDETNPATSVRDFMEIPTPFAFRSEGHNTATARAEVRGGAPALVELADANESRYPSNKVSRGGVVEGKCDVREANSFDTDRIYELVLRTNQFNSDGERQSPVTVRRWLAEEKYHVLVAEYADRFNNLGVVGVLVAEREPDRTVIVKMMLSCRAFDRGVESALFKASLLQIQNDLPLKPPYLKWQATRKNHKFKGFVAKVFKVTNVSSRHADDLPAEGTVEIPLSAFELL